jgi:hypothetical protein
VGSPRWSSPPSPRSAGAKPSLASSSTPAARPCSGRRRESSHWPTSSTGRCRSASC